ncbi:hypothetical protein F2Q68_00009692 [Brassica cretica]|uniref:No apical meristem-associated C-terminal domain-containing protein n=1 Tax=Brassica cretica TaxID=69181 RepID=A0A8S9KZ21_BRACR|nr:hypothetical protein F2Q68_00009692 [Brassica cretica]
MRFDACAASVPVGEKRFAHKSGSSSSSPKWILRLSANEETSEVRDGRDTRSFAMSNHINSGDESTTRPPGIKAAKARSKKPIGDAKDYEEFQTMWSLKKEDLTMKKELSKIKLLETLIAKEGPLADYEETLKKKLINELGFGFNHICLCFYLMSERVKVSRGAIGSGRITD